MEDAKTTAPGGEQHSIPNKQPSATPQPKNEGVNLAEQLAQELTSKLSGLVAQQASSDPAASRVMENLISTVSRLQVENEMLNEELGQIKATLPGSSDNDQSAVTTTETTQVPKPLRFETLHFVHCADGEGVFEIYYLDPPRLHQGDTKDEHLRGTIKVGDVDDVDDYLSNHPEVVFAELKEYECNRWYVSRIISKEGRGRVLVQDSSAAECKYTRICIGSAARAGITAVVQAHPGLFPSFGKRYVRSTDYFPPYFPFYLQGRLLMEKVATSDLDGLERESVEFLCQWMADNCRESWNEADELFAQGKVNKKHWDKLFWPGDLIVSPDIDGAGRMQCATVQQFPDNSSPNKGVNFLECIFNGAVLNVSNHFGIDSMFPNNMAMVTRSSEETVDIKSLKRYPLRFAADGTREKLVARGNKFWQCRRRRLVCYNESSEDDAFQVCISPFSSTCSQPPNIEQAERRYMIDYNMYRRLHPHNTLFHPEGLLYELSGRLSTHVIQNDDNPPDDFLACLPPTIHGFDFATKTWRKLSVDRITDVTWNKKAFSQLVAPPETKELIQAVVSAHGERKQHGLDIIEGKGQGLLILLHGGPGTGKTLTAESIAEEQERPLYRVTCGDIGTEPAEVERYLGDVLEIGKAWGCVVLLDEADVFLEERSFSDQKRNAIISIFLRILEYYDGILILTTNRVGSFDEAFKSRIQLALGYPTLDEEDRLKIWRNFVRMLPRTKDRVDMDDLEMNLPKLARVEINGRQIRNIITMGRHLARFRREMLRYEHMQDAVRSVQKFNEYLDQVKGVTDDDWAREDKLR
ncbi:hypothetical protein ACJ41O_000642 [Fusarium nematophilum]